MAYIGKTPTAVPLTSGDITNGIITTAKIADDAISAAKLASGVGGKVLQTVMGSSDTQLSSTNASDTLLTKAITPTATSSNVLCMITLWLGTNTNPNGGIKLLRDSTAIGTSSNPFSSTGTFWSSDDFLNTSPSNYTILPFSWTFLDTGISTTSSTTYSVATDGFTQLYYNRPQAGTSSGDANSTFTLMEIAG